MSNVDTSLWKDQDQEQDQDGYSLDGVDTSLWKTEEAEPKPEPKSKTILQSPLGPIEFETVKQAEDAGWSTDLGLGLMKGAAQLPYLIGGVAKAIGLEKDRDDWGPLERPLVWLQGFGESLEEESIAKIRELTERQSPEQRLAMTKQFIVEEDVHISEDLEEEIRKIARETWGPSVSFDLDQMYVPGEAWGDWRAISGHILESIPLEITLAVTGLKGASLLKKSLGISSGLATVISLGGGEAVVTGASTAQQVYNSVSGATIEQLKDTPEYLKLLNTAEGENEEKIAINAKEELATALALEAGLKTGTLVSILNVPYSSYVGKLFGGEITESVSRSAFTASLLAAAAELPKSGGEKYYSNLAAIKSYDPERDPMERVLDVAVTEAVTGIPVDVGVGIAVNLFGRRGIDTPPLDLDGVEVSRQNIEDALADPDFFIAWKDKLIEVSGKNISDQDFITILEAELKRYEVASRQDAEKKGIIDRKDRGKAGRKFRWPWKKDEAKDAEGREARDALTRGQQRGEDEIGMAAEEVMRVANLDLYNRLNRIPEPVFEKMEREADMKRVREGKVLKAADEIRRKRGEVEDPTALDKIRPKPETAKVVDRPKERLKKGKVEPIVERKPTKAGILTEESKKYGSAEEFVEANYDPEVENYEIVKDWIQKNTPEKTRSGHGPLKEVSRKIREGGLPRKIVEAMRRVFEPTIDQETGESLYWDSPDYPRTGTLMDFYVAYDSFSSKERLLTKSNLTDIWNKASKEKAPEGDVLTKQGKPFKSKAGAKSTRTRKGLTESHDVVEVEGGYALRPVEKAEPTGLTDKEYRLLVARMTGQELADKFKKDYGEDKALEMLKMDKEGHKIHERFSRVKTEPAFDEAISILEAEAKKTERPENVFKDLDTLLEERDNANVGESDMTLAEIEPIVEGLQADIITYMEELDPTLRSTFISHNLELSHDDTAQLVDLLNKESGEGLNAGETVAKNELLRKMVGRPPITPESLENKGKDPVREEDELVRTTPTMFESDAESVAVLKASFGKRTQKQIEDNPDSRLSYFINQLNSWIHGIGEADIGAIREQLEQLRSENQSNYSYLGNQAALNQFIEAVDGAIELAERANELKSGGSNPNILRTSFGMELFYPAIKDIIATFKGFKGKIQARDALNKLQKDKRIKEADLEYSGLDRFLNKAIIEKRTVTKEELIEAITKMPEVEVEIRATGAMSPNRMYMLDQARKIVETMPGSVDIGRYDDMVNEYARSLGISIELMNKYVYGLISKEEFISLADVEILKYPAQEQHSVFRRLHRPNSPYEYDEILISLPEYGPQLQDMVHREFEKSMAFFVRMSRNHEKFVVEELQSELDTMKGKGRPDVPAPYKTNAWPNLIASVLIKRARSLGYKSIYMPTFEWVNERWSKGLPHHVKPIYEKIFPEAMERLGAKRLADEVVEDARLTRGTVFLEERIAQAIDSMARTKRVFGTPTKLADRLDTLLREIDDNIVRGIADSLIFLEPADTLGNGLTNIGKWMVAKDLVSGVQEGAVSWSSLTRIARLISTKSSVEIPPQDDLVLATMAGADAINLSRTLHETGVVAAAREAQQEIDRTTEPDSLTLEDDVIDYILGYIGRDRTRLDIPFQHYQLPKEDPPSKSVGITLSMGFDPTNIVRLFKRKEGKGEEGRPKPSPHVKGAEVARDFERWRKEGNQALKDQAAEMKRMSQTLLTDVTAPMKSMFKKEFGAKASKQLIDRIILNKGHSVRASMFLNRAIKDIYGRLSRNKRKILNDVIFGSRIIQISRYKGNITDYGGKTAGQYQDMMNNLEEIHGLTEKEALDIFRRADVYFDKTRDLLTILYEDGLITKDEYSDLWEFRWTRTEALKKLDPEVKGISQSQFGRTRRGATVRESGIEELELGSELETPNIDMEYILADWTQRVMKRSALAEVNRSMWELANSEQKNELILPAKNQSKPRGWRTIEMIVEGKKRKTYVHPVLARYMTTEMTEISPLFANIARIASGSFILRPLATGIAVGFIPVNIAMDMILQQFSAKYMDAAGNERPTWNRWVPIATGQQLWEMGKVMPSTLFRGKKYQKFADAGGSMLFLSTQGRPLQASDIKTRFGRGWAARWAQFSHKVDSVTDAASYLNTSSEILTRLSLVEKALDRIAEREGVSKEEARANKDMYKEAVAVARDYLDFGQGGSLVKAIDSAKPYTNATFQAGRSMVNSWRKDWKHAALQSAQVAGIAALLTLGRHGLTQRDEEEDKGRGITRPIEDDIPVYDQANNFNIFPFGKEFYYTDEYGNRSRPYLNIPVDGLLIPPKILGEVAASYMMQEPIRGDVIREGMKKVFSGYAMTGSGIPSLDAYMKVAHNLDTFFGGKVWKYGDYIKASERITDDTPQFFVDLVGGMNKLPGVNMSPYQFAEAAKDIGANGNWMTHYFGKAYDSLRDVPEDDRETMLFQALSEHPFTRRMIGMTIPDVNRYDRIEGFETEALTADFKRRQYVKEEAKRIRAVADGELKQQPGPIAMRKKLSDWIEENAKTEEERKQFHEILIFHTEMPSTPRFSQWQGLTGKTPETKAKEVKLMLEDAGPAERDQIMNEAVMFPHVDSEAFWREFDLLTQQGWPQ